jgi:hypothetical protein
MELQRSQSLAIRTRLNYRLYKLLKLPSTSLQQPHLDYDYFSEREPKLNFQPIVII